MKRLSILFLALSLFIFVLPVKAQQLEKEEVTRNNLIKFKSKLINAKPDIIQEILFEIKTDNYFNDLFKNFVAPFEDPYQKNKQIIESKKDEIYSLSVQEKTYRITGRIEAVESGYSMVNTGDGRGALKGRYKVGSEFDGYILDTGESMRMSYIGGQTLNLRVYEVVPENKSPLYKDKLKSELESIEYEQNRFCIKFLNDCISLADYGITENEEILMDRHYQSAENYRKSGKYQKELEEYNFIARFNANYRDIKNNIITANKEIKYLQAGELAFKKKYLEAAGLYLELAFPASFKESYNLFMDYFKKHLASIITQANQSNDILLYLTAFSLVDEKGKASGDPGTFNRMKKEYIPDFREFVLNYYNPEKNPGAYNIVPEGSFESPKEDKTIDVPGFLVSKEPVNYALLESFKIINGESLNLSYNKYTSFEELKIPGNILRQIASWIKTEPVTTQETEYLNCDGWESIKEKKEFLRKFNNTAVTLHDSNSSRVSSNYNDYSNYFKIPFDKITNKEFRKLIERKADVIADEREEDVDTIKDAVD